MTGVDERMASKGKAFYRATKPSIALFYSTHQTYNVVVAREVPKACLYLVEFEPVNAKTAEGDDNGVSARLIDIDLCAKVAETNTVGGKSLGIRRVPGS